MLGWEKFDLGGIAMALQDQTDYEYFHLVDPRTGEMGLWTQDGGIDGRNPIDLDDVDLTVIEPLPSSVWYQAMADFAADLSDERLSRASAARALFAVSRTSCTTGIRTLFLFGTPSATTGRSFAPFAAEHADLGLP